MSEFSRTLTGLSLAATVALGAGACSSHTKHQTEQVPPAPSPEPTELHVRNETIDYAPGGVRALTIPLSGGRTQLFSEYCKNHHFFAAAAVQRPHESDQQVTQDFEHSKTDLGLKPACEDNMLTAADFTGDPGALWEK